MELGQDGDRASPSRAHDLRHRLLRGTKTRSFVGHKDSEIAEQIAKKQPDAPGQRQPRGSLPYDAHPQAGQNDLEFLKSRGGHRIRGRDGR